ncbi:MAG: dTDP-glucose 4,6-dehydratase [Parcubacteria group bacterium Athens0714_26]|nr:MAG: dTDP-glucose 4,6-dehydratase [Parcubacteria group bacterium Athens1014_26]TSD02668.1 MAG: dTDP-glucose 4,6-dehydratase [Parcubacteria group bacterium Athens0714_26]
MNSDSSKTILVTGGCGFIGSYLCEKYLNEGHRVICLDNLQTTHSTRNINHLLANKRFTFIHHDITNPINFKEKIDWVFNFACSGSYTSYQYDPVHTTKTNTAGVINMLELAKKHGARIMQSSTSEIYGDPLENPQNEEYRGNVNMLGPRACYDEGKRCAETLFMDYYREYGVDIKIIRIFNTYGSNMDLNDGRAITNFIVNALDGKDLVIYGNGLHTRSFQYIDDLVRGIDLMMKKENFTGPVNLGNPGEMAMSDLAEMIIKKTDSKSKIVFKEKAMDDPKRRCPDITLAKKTLKWEPKISLDEGLGKTIEYFKSVQRPDKKILVFAVTYYPYLGPAEQALFELSKNMPDTEFHIITSRLSRDLPRFERLSTDSIHRVGIGHKIDKYLLPVLGAIKAYKLHKEHKYKFAWSVMASYGGLSALILKLIDKDINFLLTLDESEIAKRSFIKSKIFIPFYKILFKKADTVYLSDISLERHAKIAGDKADIAVMSSDSKSFVDQVRHTYASLINKQDKKLPRPK